MSRTEWQTTARLARSVPGWLVRCGLSGVFAHMLAGELAFSPHLATSAYVNVSEQQLARAHATALGRSRCSSRRNVLVADGLSPPR